MITAKPTKHLTGVVCAVTLDDAYTLLQAIERMTGDFFADFDDKYWAVKMRLRRVSSQIEDSMKTLDDATFHKNGVSREMMKRASRIIPQENVFYTFRIFMPEAMLLGMAMHELTEFGQHNYQDLSFAEYYYDKAVLELFGVTLLNAAEGVLTRSEMDDVYIRIRAAKEPLFADYLGQYIDHCNVSHINCPDSIRKHILSNLVNGLLVRDGVYSEIEKALNDYAARSRRSVHELYDANLKYPNDIEW